MKLMKLHEITVGDGTNPSQILIPLTAENRKITVRKISAWNESGTTVGYIEIGLGMIPNMYVLARTVGTIPALQITHYDEPLEIDGEEMIYAVFDTPADGDICHLFVLAQVVEL